MTRRAQPLRRRPGIRPEYQRILIYCEGELTEVSYFKGIKEELRAGTVRIEIGREHREPLGLVKAAIDHQRRAPSMPADRFESYDEVWCVFDVEAPNPHPNLDAALQLADRWEVRCAVSNPCFELWLLLHFRDQTGYLDTNRACERLAACDCGYSLRTKRLDYKSLRDKRLVARARAVRVAEQHRDISAVRKRNPWTSVHILVDRLFGMA